MRRLFGALLACVLALILCSCSANPTTAPADSSVQGSNSVQHIASPPGGSSGSDVSAGPQNPAPVQDVSVPDDIPNASTAPASHSPVQDKPENPPTPTTPAPEKKPSISSTPTPEESPPASSTSVPDNTAPPESSSSSAPDEPPEPAKTMEEQLDELRTYIADLEWAGAHMDEYPSELGTLAVYRTPDPHTGARYNAILYRNDGTSIALKSLLPACWQHYFNPRDIQFSEDGNQLTFISPIEVPLDSIELKELRDTLCTLDLTTGEILSTEPLNP